MATFKEQIVSDAAAGGTFLPVDSDSNPDEFNETMTYYPAYDAANAVSVNVIFDRGRMEGTREVRGDGVVFNRTDGRTLRESAIIECPATLNIRRRQPTKNPDVFVDDDGDEWAVKRIEGIDGGMQSVVVVRRENTEVRMEGRAG